jgi:hypothetical protein
MLLLSWSSSRRSFMLKAFILILIFSLSSFVFGENYQYQLKGTYKLESSVKEPVTFSLKWSEENGDISGTYQDNYFTQKEEVDGFGSRLGRTFIVEFPQAKKGVRSITLLTAVPADAKAGITVPVSVVTRDKIGNPLSTVESKTAFNVLKKPAVAQLQEEESCVEGFGALAGYCGIYAGLLAEESDSRNKCNLLFADAVRLELTEAGMLYLHLGEVNQLINTPGHSLGRVPYNPENESIDMLTRVCGQLSGVNSSRLTCKRLHLLGDFNQEGNDREFTGTYTISEEGSNFSCSYSMTMTRRQ